jgi:hypothetical protein
VNSMYSFIRKEAEPSYFIGTNNYGMHIGKEEVHKLVVEFMSESSQRPPRRQDPWKVEPSKPPS